MNPQRREAILDALRSRAPRAMHISQIAAQAGIPHDERERALALLDDLAREGVVSSLPGLRYRMRKGARIESVRPSDASGRTRTEAAKPKDRGFRKETREPRAPRIEARREPPSRPRDARGEARGRSPGSAPVAIVQGILTLTTRGFGFVASEDGGPDVFIPAPFIGPAMHGDRVEVYARPSPKGREGEVFGILSRRNARVTGTLTRLGPIPYVEADDPRLRSPMPIEGEIPAEASEGLAVIAEIIRYPQLKDEAATVRVLEALGVQGTTTVEVAKIKIREGVVEDFPPEVLEEARAIPASVPHKDKKDREDLRGYDLVTIDPPDARDFDDALWAERRKGGGFRILVAIADVSHYVRPGSAIDREAIDRSTSIYLPDRAIPMLPAELSSNLASLVPHRDRLCLAVDVEISAHGKIESYRYIEGLMRSGARLTYGGAARALGLTSEGAAEPLAEEKVEMLRALLDASRALRKMRMKRGALDFDLPEPKVVLDENGIEPIDVVRARKDPGVREAYRLVEEMALLANEVVAADLTRRGVPAIYRVHGIPDAGKIELFAQLATSMGHDLDAEAAQDPKRLTAFLKKIEGAPEAPVLRYLLLRAMQQAVYDTTPSVGHFGLAAKDYLHFTSPIRRYPDLAVHRVVRQVIRGERIDGASLGPLLRSTAVKGSLLERRAMSVERDVVDLYRTVLMRDQVGEEFDATISGMHAGGFYCSLDAPFVDALVPLERLDDDYYELDQLGIRLTGALTGNTFALGDRVRVTLLEVNIARRELVAVPVGYSGELRASSAGRPSPSHGRRQGPPGERRGPKPAPKAKGKGRAERPRGAGRKGGGKKQGKRRGR